MYDRLPVRREQTRRAADRQCHLAPLAFVALPEFGHRRLGHLGQIDVLQLQLVPAGLQLGDGQDIDDELEHLLARLPGIAGIVDVAAFGDRSERLLGDHVAEADDRVERRAQLVAHRGEEGRLGGIGAARLVARRRQGDLGALALGDVLERPLQVGGVVLGRRYLGAQAQGARHAVRRDDLMVDIDPLTVQAAAQGSGDRLPVGAGNPPQQRFKRQGTRPVAQPEHPAQFARAFDPRHLRQPAEIADAGDPLRLGQALLAEDQASQVLVGAQHIADAVRQDRPVDRLVDEIGGADAIGFLDRVDVVERGGHQHRRVASARQCANGAADIEAVHLGHHHIEQHEVRLAFGEALERRGAALRLDDLEAGGFEHLALQKAFGLVVVGDQDQRVDPLKLIGHHATRGRRAVRAACARR